LALLQRFLGAFEPKNGQISSDLRKKGKKMKNLEKMLAKFASALTIDSVFRSAFLLIMFWFR
jgi:hypothetical protein